MNFIDLPENIQIPIFSNIGVMLSGGADSAILALILMHHLESINSKETIHIFSTHSREKGLSSIKSVNDVISKCAEITGFTNIVSVQQIVDSQNIDNLFKSAVFYLDSGQVDKIYTGITAAPPPEIHSTFSGVNHDLINRDSSTLKQILANRCVRPFINKDKKFIKSLYDLYNAEELFAVTRSCEQLTSVPLTGHCGRCWWCEERKWAFGML